MFKKLLEEGEAGDNVGLLLRGIEKTQIRRGMVLCKPGSITPHTDFKGEVYVLAKKKVAVILHFSINTVRSFISELQT